MSAINFEVFGQPHRPTHSFVRAHTATTRGYGTQHLSTIIHIPDLVQLIHTDPVAWAAMLEAIGNHIVKDVAKAAKAASAA